MERSRIIYWSNKFSKYWAWVNIELGYTAFYAVLLGSEQGRDLYKKKLIRLSEQYRMTKQLKFIDNCKNMALAYKISDIIVSASIEP